MKITHCGVAKNFRDIKYHFSLRRFSYPSKYRIYLCALRPPVGGVRYRRKSENSIYNNR
jgi:hypothetical protein